MRVLRLSSWRRSANESRPAPPVAAPVRLGHRLAYPAAGLHGRARLLHRRAGRPASRRPGARSISASRPSGSRSSRSPSAWASSPASSCRSSSAPTGAATPTRRANVLSPLLAYEGLTAFFLEAAFLGVLLFGRKLVPRWAHFVAALMVALGTLLSSFWILAANSWMQTPAGLRDRRRPLHAAGLARRSSSTRPSPIASRTRSSRFYVTTGFVVVGVAAC